MVSFRRKKADPRQGRGYRAVQSAREDYAARAGARAADGDTYPHDPTTETSSDHAGGRGTSAAPFAGAPGVSAGGASVASAGASSDPGFASSGTAGGTSSVARGAGSARTPEGDPWGAPPPRLGEVARHRRKKWMIGIALVMVLAILAGVLIRTTPIIRVSAVEVHGNDHTATDSVIQASGVEVGDNLAAVHTDRAAHAVVALPWVREATVTRDWFRRQITIEVTEASVSVWVDSGGDHLFDPDGTEIATVSSGTHPEGAVQWKTTLPADPATAEAVAHIVTKVQQGLPDSVSQISGVEATNPNDVTVQLSDGRSVRWGTADNLDAKLEAMKVVLSRDGKAWDISNPRQVSVTY